MNARKWLSTSVHSLVFVLIGFLCIITYRYIRNFYSEMDELGDKAISLFWFSIILGISIIILGLLMGRLRYHSYELQKRLEKIEICASIVLMLINVLVTLINFGDL